MRGINKSPWILHYDASSCNGCDIETLACLTPIFDVERLGVDQHRQSETRRHFPGDRRRQ